MGGVAARLHLKEALVEDARDCNRPATLEGVHDALRARFGLITREARTKLTALKKTYNTSLMEHSVEVERLVNIAYVSLNERQRRDMAMDQFASTLGHVALQRHLLAVQPVDLAAMIRAGNEYLSLQVTQPRYTVQTVDVRAGGQTTTKPAPPAAQSVDPMTSALCAITQVLGQIAAKLENGGQALASRPGPPREVRTTTCWGCGKIGHVQGLCPTSAPVRPMTKQSGNGGRPQALSS
jgi:hypothetical protein